MMLIEAEDYWLVTMEGEPINQLVIDWQVRLRAYDHPVDVEIVLTSPFRVVIGGQKHVVRPGEMETMSPLLAIYRKPVASVVAQKDGRLEVRFSNGDLLQAKPDEDDESWELAVGDGPRLVCLPGGELASYPDAWA
jgi:hypothetical protein